MLNTAHISDLVLNVTLGKIKQAMVNSGNKGMRLFDDALLDLYKVCRITLEQASHNADSRNDLEAKINFS
ncbi:MAG: hypothetical protein P1P93_01025 [Gammaproteobacteria bacterium]|nr:hypothetical protein [Gammaproteobacteria bacterium]